MKITTKSYLSLVPTKILKDKKNYIVEDCTSGDFYEMPEICIEALHYIQRELQLVEIEMLLKHKYPDEEVNILDFAQQLLELKLLLKVDGIEIENNKIAKDVVGFLWIPPILGKTLFNKIAVILYFLFFLVDIILVITHPNLIPHYKDIFIFKYMFLNIPAWLVITTILVMIHELGHILAIRAHDLPTRVEVGHRLFLVVLETDLSSAWKLPSKQRNVLYIAGLCFDTVILFLALAGQLILGKGSGFFLGIMQMVVLLTMIRMVYQCCIYMKTDLYYVFENVTGCYNLAENARQFIRKHLFFRQQPDQEEWIFAEEKNIVALYSIFYCIGVSLMLFLYIVFYIPQLVFSFKKVIPGLGTSPGGFAFWDSALFILQLFLGFFLLLFSWRKKYLHSRES